MCMRVGVCLCPSRRKTPNCVSMVISYTNNRCTPRSQMRNSSTDKVLSKVSLSLKQIKRQRNNMPKVYFTGS